MLAGLQILIFAGYALVVGLTAAFAQSTGRIDGVVRDSTGGLVPGATVTITSVPPISPHTVVNRSGTNLLFVGSDPSSTIHLDGVYSICASRRRFR